MPGDLTVEEIKEMITEFEEAGFIRFKDGKWELTSSGVGYIGTGEPSDCFNIVLEEWTERINDG